MRHVPRVVSMVVLTAILLSAPAGSQATTLAPVGDFDRPIFVASDPLDPERFFVVEREGGVILVDGANRELFADLEPWVQCCEGERGLLSIAPAPDFAATRRLYAAYVGDPSTGGAVGDIRVDAFRPGPGGDLLREPILAIAHADFATHNGGQLQFGPDGYLYLSTGDGGGVGDPLENGQDLETLLGKVIRIDPHPGQSPAYAIPPGNPFAAAPGRDEIWGYGLRNPWRFSFDRLSGDMVIADVGQGLREEVDHVPSPSPGVVGGAGANYGWNCREGFIAYPEAPEGCDGASGFADPVFDYPHDDPGGGAAHGCSITGGYVVRDPALGDLYGRYLYADFCVGELRSLLLPGVPGGKAGGDRSEGLAVTSPVSFGEDACGRLYVVSNGGAVHRLEGDAPSVCPTSASTVVGADSEAVTFSGDRLRPRLLLRVRRGRDGFVTLLVRLAPCGDNRGASVQLNRGGRSFRRVRLGAGCVARFRLRFVGAATFRAVFEGQRSQVRTIALAKPRP